MDGLIEFLLKKIRFGGHDSNSYPFACGHLDALVAAVKRPLSRQLDLLKDQPSLFVFLHGLQVQGSRLRLFRFGELRFHLGMLLLVKLIKVVPELEVATNDLGIIREKFLEGLHSHVLIFEGVRVNVGLQNQTTGSINLVLEIRQNRKILRGHQFFSSCDLVFVIFGLEALVDHVDDELHESVLVQKSADLSYFSETLVGLIEILIFTLVPIWDRCQRRRQNSILPIVSKPDVIIHATLEFWDTGPQALFQSSEAASHELFLLVGVGVLLFRVGFDDVFAIEVEESRVLRVTQEVLLQQLEAGRVLL